MLLADRLNPDDFPDSAYAREPRSGIAKLRFDETLEPQYVAEHLPIVVTFAISGYFFAIPCSFELTKSVLVLAVTAVMSGIIYRNIERSDRRNYLESGLIAEQSSATGACCPSS